jgi:hypothetical protein
MKRLPWPSAAEGLQLLARHLEAAQHLRVDRVDESDLGAVATHHRHLLRRRIVEGVVPVVPELHLADLLQRRKLEEGERAVAVHDVKAILVRQRQARVRALRVLERRDGLPPFDVIDDQPVAARGDEEAVAGGIEAEVIPVGRLGLQCLGRFEPVELRGGGGGQERGRGRDEGIGSHGFRYFPMNSKMRFRASRDSSVSPSVKTWPPAALS